MKTMPEISVDSRIIYERLKQADVGDVIPYEELSELIGRDVQKQGYGALSTAKRTAERDDRIVFGTVRCVGIKRLCDIELSGIYDHSLKKIRRENKRGMRKALCVSDFNSMPNEAKVKHNTMISLGGMLANIIKPAKIKKLQDQVSEAKGKLPMAKTLEFFKGF